MSVKFVNEQTLILLVEDNENDIALVRRTFAKAGMGAELKVIKTGEEAMGYLTHTGPYEDHEENPKPGLILLDLALPGVDGFEVLRWIRSKPELQGIRVVVLTSSPYLHDVRHAYALGANSFLTKPMEIGDAVAVAAAVNGRRSGVLKGAECKEGI